MCVEWLAAGHDLPAEQRKISHITAWYSAPDKKPGFQINHGLDYRDEQVNPQGVQGAYKLDADGRGYTLEYRIPIALLRAPRVYKPGDRVQAQFHVHWGRHGGRKLLSAMTDLTNPEGFNPKGAWDAGYHGRSQSLMMVYNPQGFRLQKNARIIQLIFFRLTSETEGYSGTYQGENIG